MAYREFSTGHFAAAQSGAASLEKNRMFTVACVRSGAQKRIYDFSFKEIDAIVSNDRRSERAFPTGLPLAAPDAGFAKTAKRKQTQVIEKKQSREMTDSQRLMISMPYGAPCETFRFVLRNERFVLTRFLASPTRSERPRPTAILAGSGPQSALKVTAKKLREGGSKFMKSLSRVTSCATRRSDRRTPVTASPTCRSPSTT
jgi:hypothetical protein